MSVVDWAVFASFWALFVTTPGPNAVNCILTAWAAGFSRALWCVAGILCQATLFLALAASGVTALLLAAPGAFQAVKLAGALLLIGLGIRAWVRAGEPVRAEAPAATRLFLRAFLIATINAKSVAGYLAAFSQFVRTDIPIWSQMTVIVPTALTLTALSYTGWCALGAWLGRRALGFVASLWLRRVLAVCFVGYGVALALI
ncbi:LysE family translocator [Jannaschia seohaensis]|uniref:Threonine/homoserine/homoserine lactone efflux protein n=1 Tax=Jannaschia seohaensis TaxID=475081 RepID=A0A2Y9B4R5_9RHOB|nr:LysE family transporter [Jannaschia seohaensis]PWJ12514.1 threonine/homoserine/homoserine lactone efflux protein [Jannaschia seohaensis]SSA50995.1 Threonine/homoserine/homoserine lactone efflux protein [Jannaschia seohaensis]